MHTAKEEMINLIHRLETQGQLTDRILKAVASDQNSENVLQQLRDGRTYESIINTIAAVSLPDSGEKETMVKTEGFIPVQNSDEVDSFQFSYPPDKKDFNTIQPFETGKINGSTESKAEPRVALRYQ